MSSLSRVAQLNLLNQVLRELFNAGVSEEDAFQQLTADRRFDQVRRATVKSIYDHLQKKFVSERTNAVAKFLKNANRFHYSSVVIYSEISDRWTWNSNQKTIIDERFVVISHTDNLVQTCHCFTLIDTFNIKLKWVLLVYYLISVLEKSASSKLVLFSTDSFVSIANSSCFSNQIQIHLTIVQTL
jgi:hypothetical protein